VELHAPTHRLLVMPRMTFSRILVIFDLDFTVRDMPGSSTKSGVSSSNTESGVLRGMHCSTQINVGAIDVWCPMN